MRHLHRFSVPLSELSIMNKQESEDEDQYNPEELSADDGSLDSNQQAEKHSSAEEEEGIRSDPEIREILDAADEDRSLPMEFPTIEEEDEESGATREVESVQNPKKAHRLYYKKKERLLKQLLPDGDENETARELIREQVNLYLKEGHETGRDGRQARTHMIEDVAAELQECLEQNVPLFDIYSQLKAMNEEAGHFQDGKE